MRIAGSVVMVLAMCAALAGCSNTLEGVGRDVESAGQKIQGAF